MKTNIFDFKEKVSFFKVFIFVFSILIVGLGQPAWSSLLGLVSASIGLALFWWTLKDIKKNKDKFLISLAWFFSVQLIHLSWMSAKEYQGSYIYIVYIALAFALALQFAWLSIYVPDKGEKLTFSRIIALAGFWVVLEWSRLYFMSGFPFNPLGLSLSSTILGRQWATLGGVYFLSFWVLLTNLYGLKMLLMKQKKISLIWFFLALCPFLYGFGHLKYHKPKLKKANFLNVLLVQTALSPEEKTGMKGYERMIPPIEQWRSILSYIKEHQQSRKDLIILPERTVPFADSTKLYSIYDVRFIVKEAFGEKALESLPKLSLEEDIVDNLFISQFLANYFEAEVLVGLEYLEDLEEGDYRAFASAFCFHPHQSHEVYHKRVLLPIVEYLPFQWCRDLAKKYNICGWYEKGDSPGLFQGKVPMAPSICIEELYGSLLRKNRQLGAKLLVNMTNDVWFPSSRLPRQHFEHGLIRCLENGLPAARACNTGVTAGLDALGRPIGIFKGLSKKAQWEKGALFVQIPNYYYRPLFFYVGNTLVLIISFGSLLFYFLHKKIILAEAKLISKSSN